VPGKESDSFRMLLSFLQGELMAWWCATLKDGGKTPSEEDLRLKVEEMKMLRF
jgi:hypothetical protein